MNHDWPSELTPYIGPTPNAITLRPERWAPGQFMMLFIGTICFVLGGIALVASDERWSGCIFACFGAVIAGIAGHVRFRWVTIEATDTGLNITAGMWRWRSRMQRIAYADVQTTIMKDDQKGFGWGLPILRHVVIERVASSRPFVVTPPGIHLAEMFGLDDKTVAALRDDLAARAGKRAVDIAMW